MNDQIRKDDPRLDLVAHARAVVRGKATLKPSTRMDMIHAIGASADHNATDVVVARNFLAKYGVRL